MGKSLREKQVELLAWARSIGCRAAGFRDAVRLGRGDDAARLFAEMESYMELLRREAGRRGPSVVQRLLISDVNSEG